MLKVIVIGAIGVAGVVMKKDEEKGQVLLKDVELKDIKDFEKPSLLNSSGKKALRSEENGEEKKDKVKKRFKLKREK